MEAQALLAKLSVKHVAAQAGRPVKSWERTEVAARARAARMVENCILDVRCEFVVWSRGWSFELKLL